jgi:chaperonin GroES
VVTASKSKAATSKAKGGESQIVPLADRLVVKNVQQEETLASGLVIPDTAKEKPQQAEVIAVGPGRVDDNGKRVPMEIAVGDVIVYAKYSGNEIKLGQEEYLILSEKDVLAKIQK